MAAESEKRKRPENGSAASSKKDSIEDGSKKKRKLWRVPKDNRGNVSHSRSTIEPGDAGIWATCTMDKEVKSQHELLDLFEEYAEILYGTKTGSSKEGPVVSDQENAKDGAPVDIEAEINEELAGMKTKKHDSMFTIVKTGIQCVIFIKTKPPIDPVILVHRVCKDAFNQERDKRVRFVKRLVPITKFAKAYEPDLVSLAEDVLRPHFGEGTESKKFAIQPSIRNNAGRELNRANIIRLVADAVETMGSHKVDLTGFDLLILVEVYKNVVGMSVVTSDFRRFKRFNLDELYNPTELEKARSKVE
ncbi:THUMP domain-containing protein [Eremomyces bilateralis CBS 781.70]|uniref:THUMP domain-containing protein n=1 Tax=Eremomyces bilateralis CBS 781.70 TaxID=1392243 RepID=A0A6G1FS56_9PEZI|nr:THUMP domain-containing protein [Eremomyces bilateralis CBS 781.70]KAF1808509.1 THUMP domain-containing protein [Eremomyces bilateralis CBS 781.70]